MSAIQDYDCAACGQVLTTYDLRDGDVHTLRWILTALANHVDTCVVRGLERDVYGQTWPAPTLNPDASVYYR